MSVTTGAGGAIPKRTLPRTNSQSSTNDEVDASLLVPGKKLGKEKKGVLTSLSLIRKSKKGESYVEMFAHPQPLDWYIWDLVFLPNMTVLFRL